ncbi:MAG: aminotransferase class III-fold pyridoxal phosphate-dependent enzyme, partial [Enhydrobacter sp.]
DVESLLAAAKSVDGDIAGVIASAFKHDYGKDQELPTKAFAQAVRKLCDDTGAALILDDVRAGFRLDLAGSWQTVGVKPDLAAYSKAIANGYTLAAVTGANKFRDAASTVFMTGSFWCGAASMAAALKTLEIFQRDNTIARIEALGNRLRDGLNAQAKSHGLVLKQTGPAQMPTVLFADDANVEKGRLFTQEALRGGAWLHPQHNMFLSSAHTEADIDKALQATDSAMAIVKKSFGRD